MSLIVKCNACGGVYLDTQADGSVYFHACAPIVDPKTGRERLRDGHRDENIAPHGRGGFHRLKSEGNGVTIRNGPKGQQPAVYVELQKHNAHVRKRLADPEEPEE